MDLNSKIKYLEKSSWFPKIPKEYEVIFKAGVINDDAQKTFEAIYKIPPLKELLWHLNDLLFKKKSKDSNAYLKYLCEKEPEWLSVIVFVHAALQLRKTGNSDKFEYEHFYERLILGFSLAYVLQDALDEFSAWESYLVSQFHDFGLCAVARCIPGVYKSYVDAKNRNNKTSIQDFLEIIPEELDVFMAEKWIVAKTILPYLIYYQKPMSLGKNKEGIRIINHGRMINTILDVIFAPQNTNKIRLVRRELQSWLKDKEQADSLIKKWVHLSRDVARIFHVDLEVFTRIFFNNLKTAQEVDQKILIEDLQKEYYQLLEKYNALLEENKILRQEISDSVFIDNVTKIYNHSYFYQYLQKEIQKSIRYEYPIAILMIDVDFFHVFNETYGYPAGNSLLKELAQLISGNLRESDVFARYNNDDLIVLLPHTGLNNAMFVAKKMTKLVEQHNFALEEMTVPVKTTVSIGVSAIYPPFSYSEKDSLIKSAQKALKLAKSRGGNRVEATKI